MCKKLFCLKKMKIVLSSSEMNKNCYHSRIILKPMPEHSKGANTHTGCIQSCLWIECLAKTDDFMIS